MTTSKRRHLNVAFHSNFYSGMFRFFLLFRLIRSRSVRSVSALSVWLRTARGQLARTTWRMSLVLMRLYIRHRPAAGCVCGPYTADAGAAQRALTSRPVVSEMSRISLRWDAAIPSEHRRTAPLSAFIMTTW